MENINSNISSEEELVGIDEVQKFLNRSRASVYRYTNTDLRNLNPSFNPRKLNPEFRTDQKDPLKFHPKGSYCRGLQFTFVRCSKYTGANFRRTKIY